MVYEVLKLPQSKQTHDLANEAGAQFCDACGAAMKPMGHCKYWCLKCGFLRTCNDVM